MCQRPCSRHTGPCMPLHTYRAGQQGAMVLGMLMAPRRGWSAGRGAWSTVYMDTRYVVVPHHVLLLFSSSSWLLWLLQEQHIEWCTKALLGVRNPLFPPAAPQPTQAQPCSRLLCFLLPQTCRHFALCVGGAPQQGVCAWRLRAFWRRARRQWAPPCENGCEDGCDAADDDTR